MPHLVSTSALSVLPVAGSLAAAAPWSRPQTWRDWEIDLFGFLDAIRDCACMAWWDGSAVGLRLNGFVGMFDLDDGVRAECRGTRS